MILQLPLGNVDRIVAAFPFRDNVFVVTEAGLVFQLTIDEKDGLPVIRLTQT